jgi:carboxyl-terminal processing protease
MSRSSRPRASVLVAVALAAVGALSIVLADEPAPTAQVTGGSASVQMPPERFAPPEEARAVEPGGDLTSRAAFRRRLAEMLEAVSAHHVEDDIDLQGRVEGAIRGMLDTLDPHTHFLDADAYRAMREGQDGSFYGLGIIISVRHDREGKSRLTVISPIDGMPARRLGVRSGDIIAAISGETTDGLSLDEAVSRLRGAKGTTVTITIQRDEERFDLVVERAEIPTESVSHHFMLRPDVGFIRIKDFTKTTTPELRAAIGRLGAEGMTKLILDLRDNPGGLLDEAVTVAGTFLEPGQVVVETRGRIPGSTETRRAPQRGDRLPDDVLLIVLVNRGSASASEIVAGAIQDHDRGLIVGGTSWGKGLVQSVYSLPEETGLALTTARYFTPSGRQIQRDWSASFFDYYQPRDDQAPQGEEHETDGGRKVHSGGGIRPDVAVPETEVPPIVQQLVSRAIFFRYAGRHAAQAPGAVRRGYRATDEDLAALRGFAESEKVKIDPAQWDASLEEIRFQLGYELTNAHLGLDDGFQLLCERDPQVQAALGLWDRAVKSALVSGVSDRGAGPRPSGG